MLAALPLARLAAFANINSASVPGDVLAALQTQFPSGNVMLLQNDADNNVEFQVTLIESHPCSEAEKPNASFYVRIGHSTQVAYLRVLLASREGYPDLVIGESGDRKHPNHRSR